MNNPIQLNLLSYDDALKEKEDNLLQLLNNNENNRFDALWHFPQPFYDMFINRASFTGRITYSKLNHTNRPKFITIDDMFDTNLNIDSYNAINNYNIKRIGQPFQLLLNFNKPKPIIHKWFNSLLYKRKKGKLRHY